MAYAAVISLKLTIERLKNPTINPQIIKSAYHELESMQDLLKRLDDSCNRSIDRSVLNAVDAKIIEAVYKLEDVIEFHELHHSHPNPTSQEIHSFLKMVKQFQWIYNRVLDRPLPKEEDDDVSPLDDDFGGNTLHTIGRSDLFEKIKNELLDLQFGYNAVSLVGMAGIGKTRLAREIYRDPIVAQHFCFTAWVRVGPKDRVEDALVDIASQIERKPRDVYARKGMSELIALLLKSMKGERYLIVLDDIWSTEVLDFLIKCDPNIGNGRFLLTSRLLDAAKFCRVVTHKMRFLDNEESWSLLWQNVFVGESSFPPQLEKAGRKIAENCEGLPLLILTVANILCGCEKTEEYWNKVAHKRTTTFVDAYDKIWKVLYSSYEFLPQHLKACFLYMGVFPQSCEIPVPKLLYLWTIEDFLEPKQLHTLEDFAMECLEGLASKSLAIVCKQSYNHRIKSCKLHSAYWHLCVKEAKKNKFLLVLKSFSDGTKECIESQRRLCVQNNILFGIKELYDSMAAASTTRSLLCTGVGHEYPVPICLNLMLLKVLDALPIRLYEFPTEVVQLSELRYLALTHNGKLPSSISSLEKLQCLIVRQYHNIRLLRDSTSWSNEARDMQQVRSIKFLRDSTSFPKEAWDMQQLTHPGIMGSNLLDPSYRRELPNLLRLYVKADSCTEHVLRSICYLKKLGLVIEIQAHTVEKLSCLKLIWILCGLESLKCVVVNPSQVPTSLPHLSNFPNSLKKLSLNGLAYDWDYMCEIGWLPELEVLKLRCNAFRGRMWKTWTGRFQSLKFLLLEDMDLVHWRTFDNDGGCFPHLQSLIIQHCYKLEEIPKCFPRLQRLTIRHCYKLEEIPREIGTISTLQTMEVVNCSPPVLASAKQIQADRSLKDSPLLRLRCLIIPHYHNLKSLKETINVQQVRSNQLFRDSTYLPKEIWDMHELRHLRIMGSNLPEPSYNAELPNLVTLYVNAHSCSKAVFKSTPCLKKLGIRIELQPHIAETLKCFEFICLLHGLESLKCVVVNPRLRSEVVAPPDHLINMAWGLRKLSLNGLGYSWEYIGAIGSLPTLEVLKLRCYAFQGPMWRKKVGEFQSLEYLLLEDVDLVQWTTDDGDCFPSLRRLIIRHCYKLKEMPSHIGGIPALEMLEVVDCGPLIVASAQKIQEQIDSSVEVVIDSSWKLRR